jgi:hypothetical protein
MSKPQHRTAEYLATRKRLAPIVEAGQAFCSEPRCLMRSRWIPPGTPWDLSHDTTGQVILGPSHRRCNRAEAATRGNKSRSRLRKRWTV